MNIAFKRAVSDIAQENAPKQANVLTKSKDPTMQ
jgi:hypothetical protein